MKRKSFFAVVDSFKLLSIITYLLFNLVLKVVRIFCKISPIGKEQIVIITLHKLGDTVFTIPAIEAVRKYFRQEITIYCFSDSIPIYKLKLKNFEYCSIDSNNFYLNNRFANHYARIKLRSLQPTIIFDLTGTITSVSLIFNSKAKIIIGTNRKEFKSAYELFIPLNEKHNLVNQYLDIVQLVIGASSSIDESHSINPYAQKIESIAIHPFAGWISKEWNFNKFLDLAEYLSQKYKVIIIACCGSLKDDVVNEIKFKHLEVILPKSIDELVNIIRDYSMIIGNDSGPIYIASILNKVTFTIYGPTNPLFSLPFGIQHGYAQQKMKCNTDESLQMCFTNGGRNGCSSIECMNSLSLQSVIKKIQLFIDELNFDNVKK